MTVFLPIAQIVIAILLIIAVLLQQRGTALGGAFGGDSGSFYSTRRGIQDKIYKATIVLGILFILLAVLSLAF